MRTIAGLRFAIVISSVLFGCGYTANQTVSPANVPTNANSDSNQPTSQQSSETAQVVQVTASNFQWTLDHTTFKKGSPIEFDLTSTQGVHGFSIDGTGVSQIIKTGDHLKVTWTPPKSGSYTIRCMQFCGSGHRDMYTTFSVE